MTWLSRLFRKDDQDTQLDSELRFHVEQQIAANRAAGMPPDEARRRALSQFGGLESRKEETREARGTHFVETLLQDIRYALRMLRKSPGFTTVAVLTLALGIGANTTIFSFVSAVMLRKPPFPNPDRVVALCSKNPTPVWAANRSPVSVPDFLDWRAQSSSFSGVVAVDTADFTLSGGTEPERVTGARVSPDYFSVLGITPVLGRAFAPGEDRASSPRVVMLSEGLWRRRFAADPQIIGRSIRVDGESYTIVGIISHKSQLAWSPSQIWMPLVFTPKDLAPHARKTRTLFVLARLKPGVNQRQAQADVATIAARLAVSHPDADKNWGARVITLQQYTIEDANVGTAMTFLMATVGFVLLIACANLANLLVARALTRRLEFAIRAAMGASRLRLARQLLSECLVLALAGGCAGIVLADFALQLIRLGLNWSEGAIAIGNSIRIDNDVLLFTLAVAAITAFLFGLAPALQLSRTDLQSDLKEGSRAATIGRKRHRLQRLLVVGELFLSLILLVSAAFFAKSFVDEMRSTVGMNRQNVITATVSLNGPAYQQLSQQIAFFQQALRQIDAAPDIKSAAVTTDLPLAFPVAERFTLQDHPVANPDEGPRAGYYAITPAYFSTIETPLLAGREFTDSDIATAASVVIVDSAFAHQYFVGENPVGQRIRLGSNAANAPWSEIVGVVGEVKEVPGQEAHRAHIYAPLLQRSAATLHFVVRTRTEPGSFAGDLRRAIWSIDKELAVTDVKTMDRVAQDSEQGDDVMAGMMTSFAGMALLLAAVGIYGLMSYLVGQRTHEVGVRMAFGATRRDILGLILRGALALTLPGVLVGWLVSLALPKLFAASFEGFNVRSGGILVAAPLVVLLAAFLACYIPARRAMRVDPMVALRYE